MGVEPWLVLSELVEAAARSGEPDEAAEALQRLAETTQAAGTDWALGVEARCRALVSDDWAAETHYHEAIDRLGRTSIRGELTRARLLYGVWLRRQNRRADSQVQLRTAHDAFTAMGMEALPIGLPANCWQPASPSGCAATKRRASSPHRRPR
jgi:hypothetical protein